MRRTTIRIGVLIAALLLAACGHRGPETCDGGDRRPINLGKWNETLSFECGRPS